MIDVSATFETLQQWGGFLSNHLPLSWSPNPVAWSSAAVFTGVVLVFWGARLLRTIYTLSFMIAGAAMGVRLANVGQVEQLVGLIVGAGVAAMVGYLLFRWWVALTMGVTAVLILMLAGAPRLNAEILNFNDLKLGVGNSGYVLPSRSALEAPPADTLRQYAMDFRDYLMEHRRGEVIRTGLGLALVWLLGTVAGLLLPRLTMILGTSLLGTVIFSSGASLLLATRWPGAWTGVVSHKNWFLGGLAVLLLAGLSYQSRRRRPMMAVSAPAPATA